MTALIIITALGALYGLWDLYSSDGFGKPWVMLVSAVWCGLIALVGSLALAALAVAIYWVFGLPWF